MSYFKRLVSKKIANALTRRCKSNLKQQDLENEVYFVLKHVHKRNTSEKCPSISVNSRFLQEITQLSRTDLENVVIEKDLDIENIAPGHKGNNLHFMLNPQKFMQEVLREVCKRKNFYGKTENLGSKKLKILVDFSSPNIAKEFHEGHLRSTVIGNSLCNLYQAAGHDVVRVNYLGDWGTQFGVLLSGFEKFGNEASLEENALAHLSEVYVRANKEMKNDPTMTERAGEINKHLEAGNKEYLKMWERFRNISISEYKKLYNTLGVEFDVYEGESMYYNKSKEVIDCLEERGCIERSDTSELVQAWYQCPKSGNKREVVLQKTDGTSLYITRDLAAALERKRKYGIDALQYVVDQRQVGHFINLLNLLNLMEPSESWSKGVDFCRSFGPIEGLSTREGKVLLLRDIIDDLSETMLESMQHPNRKYSTEGCDSAELKQRALTLAVSHLIYTDLRSNHNRPYKWKDELENVKSWKLRKGNVVPVQYCHARLCQLLENPALELTLNPDVSMQHLISKNPTSVSVLPLQLVTQIARLEEVIHEGVHQSQSYCIHHYIESLVALIGKTYENFKVYDKSLTQEEMEARYLLFFCARQTLSNALQLLGIPAMKKV
uniref:Probable arginine--tRNA ligase, mitochondrial n=1 Tax=Crassostrea virginica TaxID=6565 RepID=A0A8B8EU74_CRAVI|nr:probable arginine--tRNA ligase, mitochondrial [Crassostrea virginica]